MNIHNKIPGKFGLAALILSGLFAGHAQAADFTMKLAAGASSSGNVCKGFIDVWAEKIKAESAGRIDYELYCDGTLAKMGDAVNRVEQGIADAAWDVPAAYGARFGGLNVIGVPGLYTDPEVAAGALWNAYSTGKLGEQKEVRLLVIQAVNNNSYYMANPLKQITDLDGAKIGMGSKIRATVIDTMGGVPVALKVPEYYQAMSKGAIDGIMSTAGAVFDFGLQDQLKQIWEGPFGGGMTMVVMNNDFYTGLPDDLKKVIDDNSGYATSRWASAYLRDLEEEQVAALPNVEVDHASAEDLAVWQKAFDAARSVYLADDPKAADYLAAFEVGLKTEAK
jgi:TRAP-type transport system periplasmic protein